MICLDVVDERCLAKGMAEIIRQMATGGAYRARQASENSKWRGGQHISDCERTSCRKVRGRGARTGNGTPKLISKSAGLTRPPSHSGSRHSAIPPRNRAGDSSSESSQDIPALLRGAQSADGRYPHRYSSAQILRGEAGARKCATRDASLRNSTFRTLSRIGWPPQF